MSANTEDTTYRKPGKGVVAFSLTPYAKEKLEQVADAKGVSRSAIVEMAIRKYAKEEGDG